MTGVGGDSSRSLPPGPLAWLEEAQGAWFQVLGTPRAFAPRTVAGRGLSNGMTAGWSGLGVHCLPSSSGCQSLRVCSKAR